MRPCVCARRPAAEAPTDGKPSRLRPDNSCSHPVVVIGPFNNDSAATTPRRNAGHAEVSTTGFRISDEESSSIC
jgi:hypothetical protein